MATPTTLREHTRQEALDQGRDYVNSSPAADYLGITDGTLRKWRVKNDGPRYQKVGGEVRYYFADLDAWLAEQFIGGDDR